MSADAEDPTFMQVMCTDTDAHWPLPSELQPTCGLESAAVLFVFRRDRVTCAGCKAWLAQHPFVTTWDREAKQ